MGKVIGLYIAPDKGAPMESVKEVRAVRGRGLEGDRHYYGRGTMFGPADEVREVTIICVGDISRANQRLVDWGNQTYTAEQLRRNILVADVELNGFVGKEFIIGGVRMLGTELAQPCKHPPRLLGRTEEEARAFRTAFMDRAGIRARILSDGLISLHDVIELTNVVASV
jgi:MOSC domain-containing protein YiiM